MGQSGSTDESQVQDNLQLSEDERNYVRSHLLSTGNETKLDFTAFKESIDSCISSEIVDKTLSFLQSRCVSSGNKFDSQKLLEDISLLTHGTSDDFAEVLYQIMNLGGGDMPLAHFENMLINALSSLSFKSTHFDASKQSCQRYANFIMGGMSSTQFSEEEFLDFFQKQETIIREIFQTVFQKIFLGKCMEINQDLLGHCPVLIPVIETPLSRNPVQSSDTTLSLPDVIFLNSHLPIHLQHKWRMLYSTRLQGESFSRLCSQALDQGPLLVVVEDSVGHVFGGFISTNLVHSSKFQGDEKSFLFTASPKLSVHNTTGYNDHYAYFNVGQETMPNGLGMGGQHGYYGLWLSAEFGKGHSRAKTKCTTYGSPRLSSEEEFKIVALEAWGVGDESKEGSDEEEEGTSVIDRRPDVIAMLQIAGKERVSEGYRDGEQSSVALPGDHHLHDTHDTAH